MRIDFSKGMEDFAGAAKASVEFGPTFKIASERLLSLKTGLDEAQTKALFVPLPDTEPKASKDRSRIMTIRNRLTNLGYLTKDSGSPELDLELKRAIKAFQEEAGLQTDGWVGEITWQALQELVSFEASIDLLRWLPGGRVNPALRRAAALRLFVLGLVKEKPISADVDLLQGLKALEEVWIVLKLGRSASAPALNLEWLDRLFNQDNLVKKLSRIDQPIEKSKLLQIHGFLLNVAKIELWLAGYNIPPTGYDLIMAKPSKEITDVIGTIKLLMKSRTVTQNFRIKKNQKFYNALKLFWEDIGKNKQKVSLYTVNFLEFFPEFFKTIDEGLESQNLMTTAEKQEKLETFINQNPQQIPTAWQKVRCFGNRVWDGIKRTWGWLKNLFQRAVDKNMTIGLNISRLIYDFSLGAFTVLANVYKSFSASFQYLSKPYLPLSSAEIVIISHDKDLDFKVYINQEADGIKVTAKLIELNRTSRLFNFTCRVIRLFLSVIVKGFRLLWAGYVGLILSLVRFRRLWDQLRSLVKEYRELFPNPA
jgi:hypothetical protein